MVWAFPTHRSPQLNGRSADCSCVGPGRDVGLLGEVPPEESGCRPRDTRPRIDALDRGPAFHPPRPVRRENIGIRTEIILLQFPIHAAPYRLRRRNERACDGRDPRRPVATGRTRYRALTLSLVGGPTVIHERIEVNPAVMLGKPVIRGTRITVELILGKLAEGATEAELLDGYPRLTAKDIRAAKAYAADA